jgi:capsular polysaccharide biosynthesis protein
MEFKEYLAIIKANFKLFGSIITFVILSSFSYFYLQPTSYEASLVMNITRSGLQKSDQYKFDDFYRLQADEKFAETLAQWIKSPRLALDIWTRAGNNSENLSLRQLSKLFKAEKLSSQIVSVKFSTTDLEKSKKISESIVEIISRETAILNQDQQEENWFKIVALDPVILISRINPFLLFLASLSMGIFLGFWIVLVRHYFKQE